MDSRELHLILMLSDKFNKDSANIFQRKPLAMMLLKYKDVFLNIIGIICS